MRFSLRNVQEINNTEPRFQTRAGVTWKDCLGSDAKALKALKALFVSTKERKPVWQDKVGLETSSSSVAALTEGVMAAF